MSSFIKKILIVDDSLEDRHTYSRYLKQDGIGSYQVIESETGEEGLECYYQHKPDLILLDFNLPDLNGIEFIEELKTNCDSLPPIIILTAVGNETIAVKAMKAGVKDYLVKGKTNAESFGLAIRSALEQARLQRLAESKERKFRICVENMLDCFGIYTSVRDDRGEIISFQADYLNQSACQDNLFNLEEPTNQDVCGSVAFDSQAELFELCCQVVETGKPLAQEYSLYLESEPQETITKVFEIKINKLEDGFVAVWRDITESIEIEKALQQSEAKFRVLVNQAPVGIFQTDCEGDCVYVNPRWLEIVELSLTEAMGQGWSKALHPSDRGRVFDEWYEAAKKGKEFASEYRFQSSSSGKTTWVAGRAVATYNDLGERSGYFGTIIDISERKKTEALLNKHKEQLITINHDLKQTTFLLKKRNQELDDFTSIVSHDLKAPLRAITNLSMWIEEDLEDKLDDDTRHNLQLLKSRVARMGIFIESLLKYSRVGKEKIPTVTFAVKDLLIDIVDSLAPPPEFVINIDRLMPIINTQKIALEQVFTNLIGNAIKHHQSQSGTINISATEDEQFYYFSVTDDGAGIAVEHQERIFGIFQTLSSRDHTENTGIGLSIVKKIVENQGGTIELNSEVGKGTTFRFSWSKTDK